MIVFTPILKETLDRRITDLPLKRNKNTMRCLQLTFTGITLQSVRKAQKEARSFVNAAFVTDKYSNPNQEEEDDFVNDALEGSFK